MAKTRCLKVSLPRHGVTRHMPYKDPHYRAYYRPVSAKDVSDARSYKKAKNLAAVHALPTALPVDPVGELSKWATATLRVPPGHPLRGRPYVASRFCGRFLTCRLECARERAFYVEKER